MMKLLRAAVPLCAVLLAVSPALAGSPFTADPATAAEAAGTVAANAGLWTWISAHVLPTVDQAVISIVGLVVGAVSLKARQWFGVSISAAMQDQLRQTALTGAHLAINTAEGAADRAGLVDKAVTWMKVREPAIIGKLGFSDQVLAAIALKMVSAALSGAPAQSAFGGSAAVESPAMDHAAGNKPGGR